MSTTITTEKYYYAQSQTPEDVLRLQEHTAQLTVSASAPNTVKAYAFAWKLFSTWCANWRHCESLPATTEAVAEFIAWCSQMRNPQYKAATIRLILAAICRTHKDAGLPIPNGPKVRAILAGVQRQHARSGVRPETEGKKHLTVEQLRQICARLGSSPVDVRDRALVLLGFASALRRSDLSRVDSDHLYFENADRLRLWVPRSKTDQTGVGRYIYIASAKDTLLCPLRALQQWKQTRLAVFGYTDGPLFLRSVKETLLPKRLPAASVSLVLKKHLEAIGEDATLYGAHSMRSGMITAADAAGASLRSIMDRSGHKSIEMVMRYIKPNRGNDPLSGVL